MGHLEWLESYTVPHQEMLGIEVNYTGLGAGSLDGIYAVTGCKTPMDSNNRGCTGAPGLEEVAIFNPNPNPKRKDES